MSPFGSRVIVNAYSLLNVFVHTSGLLTLFCASALFLPAVNGHYVAFNRGASFRYMDADSLQRFRDQDLAKEYIVAQIVEINEGEATPEDGSNPFNLPLGTTFYTCMCALP